MKSRLLFIVLAFFVFTSFMSGYSASAKMITPDQLVAQAESNAKQLSNIIYYEKSKKLGVVSSSILSKTYTSINLATTSVKKLKNTTSRKKLETKLKNVQITYNRALSYHAAIKVGEGLKGKTNSLLKSYAKNPASDYTETFYQSVQSDLRKLTTATGKVYGKSTQNAIYSTYKVPSERALSTTKSAHILKSEVNLLRLYMKSGKNEAAYKQVDRFNSQLKSVKANFSVYQAFANSYENVLKEGGVSTDGIPTVILKKIIAQEESVVYLEVFDQNNELFAQGSGFIVGKSTILTNFHVVQDGYRVVAYTTDGDEIAIKGVVKYNIDTDLAILATSKDLSIPALIPGDMNLLEKGDSVVAIGSPEGLFNTVSTGIISNLHRWTEAGVTLNMIQTTAPITHGSSGGALFNKYG
ncbi:MAG TPA: trypsin-like peptidase domain-containing protein, partial [Pseudoneobacillus sp.]|nr:trypsin-like peptidase domain-containing protein [Pseudoneobacillus sp.]